MIREGGDGGRREPDLGCDVELVDEADLLGELLAGVGGQVLTHQLQELRGFQAATVHLSARAGSRISTAKWKRRDWRRKTQEEDEGACSVLLGSRVAVAGSRRQSKPARVQLQPPPIQDVQECRHGHAHAHAMLDLVGWVPWPYPGG